MTRFQGNTLSTIKALSPAHSSSHSVNTGMQIFELKRKNLKKRSRNSVHKSTSSEKIVAELQTAMDNKRELLRQVLLPGVLENPPRDWRNTDGSLAKKKYS